VSAVAVDSEWGSVQRDIGLYIAQRQGCWG